MAFLSKYRRYVILLQLAAVALLPPSQNGLVVHAASLIRGGATASNGHNILDDSHAGIDASEEERRLQTAENRMLYCGAPGRCSENTLVAPADQPNAVRCCTTDKSLGWPDKCISSRTPTVYGESNVPGCYNDKTFSEAVVICTAAGARLCNGDELVDRCTRGTGCGFNKVLSWGCSADSLSCQVDAECCNGNCVGGTCRAVGGPMTNAPISTPSSSPTKIPSTSPYLSPTASPTKAPAPDPVTDSPTKSPTANPVTDSPTKSPTASPVTGTPTKSPTASPVTGSPAKSPTASPVTDSPTKSPVASPVTGSPTTTPTGNPSKQPSTSPIKPTNVPVGSPSKAPSTKPVSSVSPSTSPSDQPSKVPTSIPSSAPTSKALVIAGNNGSPVEAFPLAECQGDCDNDGDCQGELLCYQRTGTEQVPGCTGLGVSAKDYCASRSDTSLLFLRGDNGSPGANFPLGLCEGDCDSNSDCQGTLICKQRTEVEEVLGCNGEGASGEDYCRYPVLELVGNNGWSGSDFPLRDCEGDCDNDSECAGSLRCFARDGTEAVPGCDGAGNSATDYCAVKSATDLWIVGDEGLPAGAFPLGVCEGDCDSNFDCEGTLICEQRGGVELVPGCSGLGTSAKDYCRYPSLTYAGNNNSPVENFPLSVCEGDCDNDRDCEGLLQCFQRTAFEPVPGCLGAGTFGRDYCASRPTANTLFLKGDNRLPSANFPLKLCEGDCDSNADCVGTLACFQRTGDEVIPGCDGAGTSGEDYCYPISPQPTTSPTLEAGKPTHSPNDFGATYVPGDLSVPCDNGMLTLSKGMNCAKLTSVGQPVQLSNGSFSSQTWHSRADGAGVIPHPTDGGWYYVSNSETSSSDGGGAGSLRFDANGGVIGYEQTLTGTTDNCGGGKTYWNTWVTCEEDGSLGHCHEVDPFTGYTKKVNVVAQGGNYESFAYDNADPDVEARFFTTEDSSNGALTRYTPHPNAFGTGNPYDILSSANGVYDYLVLNTADGTFSWSPNIADGEISASALFPNSEGIDVHNRILNFVSKVKKQLFTLDLDAGTWTKTSTVSGAFNLQPDQLARIMGDSEVLYFCEDGGSACDIHGRDSTGQYFTIVRGDGYSTETTGLAFSPDNQFMYMAFQGNSNVYSFWREDGLPFNGIVAYTKYHAT